MIIKEQQSMESLNSDEAEKMKKEKDKENMFKMLIDVDQTDQMSLKDLLKTPYEVEGEDSELVIN